MKTIYELQQEAIRTKYIDTGQGDDESSEIDNDTDLEDEVV